ncbi:MAG: deoxyribose-phosphate aldolase [Lachnospiraceae bacterium]|nr:deoxyribose-phosphate aldolase [Lachnospiraceae bacterium]MDD7668101.1 deoxyribose-phosphate aldolase [Lachnospiraceae bacterium]MDY2619520.1 deoxyribose-phosphate aldolase [Agathobacter sp.]
MDREEILNKVDHTLLTQTATWEEIREILDDAMKYHTASACIPAAYVKQAAEYVQGRLPICTVIGFPNGYHTTAVKVFETKDAVANGASEIDMVINIGFLKDKRYEEIEEEIRQVHAACEGRILKVIIETCLLTEKEKIKMCEIVTKAGAEFIKTSTGFSTGGATFEDVELMRKYVGANVKVKAAGGIASFADAEKFVELGADRLGTSRLIKIMKAENAYA